MAYANGFPMTYPQYYAPYPNLQGAQMSLANQPQAGGNGSSIIWVQGEAGAKSYLVAPNTTVQLWDSERQTIYLKSADASGMPSIKTLDYTIRQEGSGSPAQAIQSQDSINVSQKDLDALQSQIDALRDELERMRKENDHGKSDLQSNDAAVRRK